MARGQGELTGKFRRAIEHGGNTLKTDNLYTPADVDKYGMLVPAVCGPGDTSDLRFSTGQPRIRKGKWKAPDVPESGTGCDAPRPRGGWGNTI